jgi:hypothetical protein
VVLPAVDALELLELDSGASQPVELGQVDFPLTRRGTVEAGREVAQAGNLSHVERGWHQFTPKMHPVRSPGAEIVMIQQVISKNKHYGAGIGPSMTKLFFRSNERQHAA